MEPIKTQYFKANTMQEEKQSIKKACLKAYQLQVSSFYGTSICVVVRNILRPKQKPHDGTILRKLRILNQKRVINYTADNKGVYTKLEVEETP